MHLTKLPDFIEKFTLRNKTRAQIFEHIYRTKYWRGEKSRSGSGSDNAQTSVLRKELPILLKKYRIKTLLDAPCGDLNWITQITLPVEKYIGVDIVPQIIAHNIKNYAGSTKNFLCADIITDSLPKADAILSRDFLVHLSFVHGLLALENFKKSGARYLIATTFGGHSKNKDIATGQWRPLNLELAPFNLPRPLEMLNEKCSEYDGAYQNKSLGIWELNSA